jgi:hypothetical protein
MEVERGEDNGYTGWVTPDNFYLYGGSYYDEDGDKSIFDSGRRIIIMFPF